MKKWFVLTRQLLRPVKVTKRKHKRMKIVLKLLEFPKLNLDKSPSLTVYRRTYASHEPYAIRQSGPICSLSPFAF